MRAPAKSPTLKLPICTFNGVCLFPAKKERKEGGKGKREGINVLLRELNLQLAKWLQQQARASCEPEISPRKRDCNILHKVCFQKQVSKSRKGETFQAKHTDSNP